MVLFLCQSSIGLVAKRRKQMRHACLIAEFPNAGLASRSLARVTAAINFHIFTDQTCNSKFPGQVSFSRFLQAAIKLDKQTNINPQLQMA